MIHACHPSAWEAGIYTESLFQNKTKKEKEKKGAMEIENFQPNAVNWM